MTQRAAPILATDCASRRIDERWKTPLAFFLGLMSGTSVDAIDAAVMDFSGSQPRVIAADTYAFEPGLKQQILDLIDAPVHDVERIGALDVETGRAFARAASELLASRKIDAKNIAAIGSHGQTIRHSPRGQVPFTWQIGDPNTIVEMTGITTVADFRRRDMAAGGEGAPLVPLFHEHMFRNDTEDRVIVNIGGIANISVLRRGAPLLGFDTGPGNRLMDAWIFAEKGVEFDRGGEWAQSGRCDAALLDRLCEEDYFRLAPPKSTGRELFNLSWLRTKLKGSESAVDAQATLLEFTVRTISEAVAAYAQGASIYVCGGGALNAALMSRLSTLAAPSAVHSCALLGLDPSFVEAAAFAWFARRTLAGETSSLASVTGSRGPRILGGVYRA